MFEPDVVVQTRSSMLLDDEDASCVDQASGERLRRCARSSLRTVGLEPILGWHLAMLQTKRRASGTDALPAPSVACNRILWLAFLLLAVAAALIGVARPSIVRRVD